MVIYTIALFFFGWLVFIFSLLYLLFYFFIFALLLELPFNDIMMFSDITQKALSGFSSTSSQINDTAMWNILPDGLTLEMVLEDKAPPPFSLKDFSDYLELTYCNENLLFYEAVTEYRAQCTACFGRQQSEDEKRVLKVDEDGGTRFDFTSTTQTLLSPKEQLLFENLKYKFETILQEFVLSDAPQEINIPYEIRHQLLQSYQIQQSYHPSLLNPACQAVIELLRISAFIPFATDPSRIHSSTTTTTTTAPRKSSSLLFKRQKSTPSLLSTNTSISSSHPPSSFILPPTPSSPCAPPTSPTAACGSPPANSVGFLKRITTSFKITRYYPFSTNVNETTESSTDPHTLTTESISVDIPQSSFSTRWHKSTTIPELSASFTTDNGSLCFPSSPSPSTPLLPSQQNNNI
ncbi:MAG: hypothetical protein EXX96DRAFT_586184 [Benjaminiella poitrasii]|nr:MAG: hypothetical protein EXX96DRAFT_586184 [Benjaminiella poitrasii]